MLAGDIGSYQDRSRLMETDFGLGRFSPARGWPAPVVYVPGNHEYDNLDFDETHDRLRELCHALDIHWLERETRVMQGVRLVGTTLWTDFDALAQPDEELGSVLKKRAKAFRAADFYGQGRHAPAWRTLHGGTDARTGHRLPAMAGRSAAPALRRRHPRHHALRPTLASADPRYGVTPGTAGFCNALDALLPRADYWLHGHLHCALDYMKDGCRVIANPLGYEKKGERENFAPARTWDVRTGKWRTADVPGGRLSRQRIDLRRAEFVDVERFERRGNVQRLVQLMRRVEQAMAADFLDQHVVLELPHRLVWVSLKVCISGTPSIGRLLHYAYSRSKSYPGHHGIDPQGVTARLCLKNRIRKARYADTDIATRSARRAINVHSYRFARRIHICHFWLPLP